jgi:hypothetical protein
MTNERPTLGEHHEEAAPKAHDRVVPSSAWGQNLRSRLSRSVWEQMRRDAIAIHHEKCAICEGGGKLFLHEVWEYDDKEHVHRLGDPRIFNDMARITTEVLGKPIRFREAVGGLS